MKNQLTYNELKELEAGTASLKTQWKDFKTEPLIIKLWVILAILMGLGVITISVYGIIILFNK